MRVLITGGTGFVGSHACRELLSAGHAVRLLVRDTDKARAIYATCAAGKPEFATGDVTDPESVCAALNRCDAVVHAAASTPLQIESVAHLFAVNVGGVRNVVDAALEQGIERIVCLSSITAIFDEDGARVTPDAAPVPSKMPYGQSKVAAELYLRELQSTGAPIAILYPGGILGPDDPGLSDSCKAIKHRVENGFRIFGDGGMQYLDVRDLATIVRSLVEEGGSGRFLVPGVYRTWTEQADILEEVSGCQLQRIAAQGWKLRLIGRVVDVVRKFRAVDTPISAETMRYATLWPRIDNTPLLVERGIELRDPRETFADTVAWMVREGHLDAQDCPRCA
ncbi:MAG: SDR family NAD(P)-dependent oxidoreductase [Halioglobus sp.]|nr:SDR family NAD(P)-dependent oxidoreductase [Halioglobus sp.]